MTTSSLMTKRDFRVPGRHPVGLTWCESALWVADVALELLICLDREFHIVHASESLDTIAPDGAAERIVGRTAEAVFGAELFGREGALRRSLEAQRGPSPSHLG